ncbi:glycine zipper 2TM domain-containing protein [Caenimonas terrae]|uniref:Glycine zipper 2TM domain-containing protein n=1 Tax=Caenimonas terrae TaxID=696074 RepID=A0ABW0NH87_9BURK
MKRAALLALIATAAVAAQAQPQFQQPGFVDRARVQSVEPQYENVALPRQECTSQWVSDARPPVGSSGYGGALVGGLAGGILGNQVGGGHGREAATAAGAVIGAITGDRLAANNQPQYEQAQREVRSCRTVQDVQQRLTGYRVTYSYAGRQYAAFMREQPGDTLPVRVSVTPVQER